ncbi:metallophosphoesterase family protein [Accumulibacter sp.]|uniref:metallophosphoesterase family protein n=1 Tax=Accumulibacter sp. TaxID=2053492 RepID=UPI0025D47621|nr:metallophosphoesterase family protein [Accumulibacter sp.]MCM8612107.1 metallophosphatase family protein [Accumulibacter sp.]MCM8635773.1 metallophosphatase family protein [Accumulibacter sp.]MCM8639590.1 metallophosphatase family protein [Accumulibacter sp.]
MIGILSDAHGNTAAFRAAIDHLGRLGAQQFYFLGDALGYIPAVEVVDDLERMGTTVTCILGNHESLLLSGTTDPQREAAYQHQLIRSRLSGKQSAFIGSWPTHCRRSHGAVELLFVHGSPADFTNEYLYPDSDLGRFVLSESFVFMGHSHYPFIRAVGGTTFVNVGSCGLPRDDGRYGSFATFDPTVQMARLYRFDIGGSLASLAEDSRNLVHSSVIRLFARRAASLVGTVMEAERGNTR